MVAGNWKMNGNNASNSALVAGIGKGLADQPLATVDVMVSPPAVYLTRVSDAIRSDAPSVQLGAQNVADNDGGAFTGEIAAPMLSDIGCQWAIIGHSERRTIYGETNEDIAQKTAQAMKAGLGVVICVGETADERKSGVTEKVLGEQIDAVTTALQAQKDASAAVIAYEPVWAIGTGETATPQMAQDAHAFIRERMRSNKVAGADQIRILYGGSVKPGNAVELFSQPDIDGGLIGGASLAADDFLAICRAAEA
jgi:triosephosphate isomerase